MSSVLLFAALLEALTSGYMAYHRNIHVAHVIERVARWAFPLAFVVAIAETLMM